MRMAMRTMTAFVLSVGVLSAWANADGRSHARDAKAGVVNLHKASSTPEAGMRRVTLPNGQSVYVSARPVGTSLDILTADQQGEAVTLRVSGAAVQRLSGGQLAVFVGQNPISTGSLSQDGTVTLNGLSQEQAERITRQVQGQPMQVDGPLLTVVPAGQEDGLYYIDVFVQGTESLRSLQISLITGGGDSGRLELVEVSSDKQREDYVFGRRQTVDASSPRTGLLATVLYDGTASAIEPMYLGTYAFRPTADAQGVFRVNVEVSDRTILADYRDQKLSYSSGADARIMVGSNPKSQR